MAKHFVRKIKRPSSLDRKAAQVKKMARKCETYNAYIASQKAIDDKKRKLEEKEEVLRIAAFIDINCAAKVIKLFELAEHVTDFTNQTYEAKHAKARSILSEFIQDGLDLETELVIVEKYLSDKWGK
jgi:hypothetical protein